MQWDIGEKKDHLLKKRCLFSVNKEGEVERCLINSEEYI